MGYMICHGTCYTCHTMFSFNPHKVPSIPANLTRTGAKEPVCKSCIERANPARVKNGLPPIAILPGAYEPEEC